MLASPLIYSGQLSKEDYELRLAHPSGNIELRFIYLCSSLILLDPDFTFSHTFILSSFLLLSYHHIFSPSFPSVYCSFPLLLYFWRSLYSLFLPSSLLLSHTPSFYLLPVLSSPPIFYLSLPLSVPPSVSPSFLLPSPSLLIRDRFLPT